MQCVILAGGLGIRLWPATNEVAKSMISVAGRPFLEYQIELLCRNGISEIVICVGYLGEQIEDYFRGGEKFGLKIDYSYEKKQLLGTAGALKNAGGLLQEEFFVLYGDSYPDISFRDVNGCFQKINYPVLMVVYKNENRWDRSNAIFQNGLVELFDKDNPVGSMKYIDYGLSVFSRKILEEIPGQIPYNLVQLYKKLAGERRLAGYEVFKRFYEIGSQQGLKDFKDFIKERS